LRLVSYRECMIR